VDYVERLVQLRLTVIGSIEDCLNGINVDVPRLDALNRLLCTVNDVLMDGCE